MKTIFFHIPKTAGTFLANQYKKVLNYNVYKFFSDNNLCEFLDKNVLNLDKSTQLQKLLEIRSIKTASYTPCVDIKNININNKTFIYSHEIDKTIHQLFVDDNWNKITVVRNPFERIISCFAQRQRNNANISLSETADNYQFYFLYLAFCDKEVLPLNKQTANIILQESINILKQFNIVFDQANISTQFYSTFQKSIICSNEIDNITKDDMVLNIPYKNIKDAISFIDYDYEFYKVAIYENNKTLGAY